MPIRKQRFILQSGCYLEYIPDPLIMYQDARYKQKNVIRMEKGATFLYSDILTPGWSPDGDRFSYDRFNSSMKSIWTMNLWLMIIFN